ncbi:hypothetical protein ABC383_15565 [Noviherbaspirillum sp. 1P10PC]|uniref:hypothetical protein n=1 Tax=Noviherbaspirillum sp. 1P10PC TaxID=3132292 RepID=UPI0039A31ECA
MERGAAKLAKLRLAQTDAAPFPAPRTDVTARSTGLKSNGNFKSNGNGNDNDNDNDNGNGHFKSSGNCRCAYYNCNGHFKSDCNRNCFRPSPGAMPLWGITPDRPHSGHHAASPPPTRRGADRPAGP